MTMPRLGSCGCGCGTTPCCGCGCNTYKIVASELNLLDVTTGSLTPYGTITSDTMNNLFTMSSSNACEYEKDAFNADVISFEYPIYPTGTGSTIFNVASIRCQTPYSVGFCSGSSGWSAGVSGSGGTYTSESGYTPLMDSTLFLATFGNCLGIISSTCTPFSTTLWVFYNPPISALPPNCILAYKLTITSLECCHCLFQIQNNSPTATAYINTNSCTGVTESAASGLTLTTESGATWLALTGGYGGSTSGKVLAASFVFGSGITFDAVIFCPANGTAKNRWFSIISGGCESTTIYEELDVCAAYGFCGNNCYPTIFMVFPFAIDCEGCTITGVINIAG